MVFTLDDKGPGHLPTESSADLSKMKDFAFKCCMDLSYTQFLRVICLYLNIPTTETSQLKIFFDNHLVSPDEFQENSVFCNTVINTHYEYFIHLKPDLSLLFNTINPADYLKLFYNSPLKVEYQKNQYFLDNKDDLIDVNKTQALSTTSCSTSTTEDIFSDKILSCDDIVNTSWNRKKETKISDTLALFNTPENDCVFARFFPPRKIIPGALINWNEYDKAVEEEIALKHKK